MDKRMIYKNPISVLQVVTHMNRGGLESMLMNYYRAMDKDTIHFDFLTHRPASEKKDFDEEIESLGGRIYHLPRLNPFSIGYRKDLDSFFKEHKEEYDIIHVHQDCMSGLILKYAQKNGYKVRIAHSHNSMQDRNLKYLIKVLYKRIIPRYSTALLACSIGSGRWMFGHNHFDVLYNAIDCERFRFDKNKRDIVRTELNITDELVIGNVGRFSPQKNHCYLVNLFAEFHKTNAKSLLLLVGDGNEKEDIVNEIERLGISDSVILTGTRKDIPDLLMAMDVFIFPSLYEGLPVTLIEAQATGLPCVISDSITDEVILSKLIKKCRLDDSAEEWISAINDYKCITDVAREEFCDLVSNSNYNINRESKKLEEYYIKSIE